MIRKIISTHPYLSMFAITLSFRLATALPLEYAGYMDASYAIHVAENLARGQGFVEHVLWNYLDNPAGLPHPSNVYWMPLPSLLIAPCFIFLGVSYRVAQIPFVLLSSLLPLFTFYLTRRLFARDDYAWTAASFTAFSGFYTIYWVSPDNFTPFALTASMCLVVIARGVETKSARYFFGAGILAGLSHLSRADGLLLLAVVPVVLFFNRATFSPRNILLSTFYVLLGYLLLMSPWFLRNYLALGSLYPSAGTKTLWLTNYDELFRFADDLTMPRYLAWGFDNILASKLQAAFVNLLVVSFGVLQIFLIPFAIVGLWQNHRRKEFQPVFVYAILLYLAMTLVFTFPSMRGTMLHSSVALLPFLAAAAPPGIDAFVQWIARRRRTWDVTLASRVFRFGFIALSIFLAGWLYAQGVFPIGGGSREIPLWNQRDIEYASIARWLDQNARADDIVMVVDPPAFYNASHRRAIVIPTDSVEAIFDAARRYNARFLILQFDHPKPLNALYRTRVTIPGLNRVAEFPDGTGNLTTLFELAR